MRFTRSLLAAFGIALALAAAADSLRQGPVHDPATSTVTYGDGTIVIVRRPGRPDVI